MSGVNSRKTKKNSPLSTFKEFLKRRQGFQPLPTFFLLFQGPFK